MNIFITRKIPENGIKLFLEKGHLVNMSDKDRPLSKKEIIKSLRGGKYDAMVSLLTDEIDAEVLSYTKGMKVISNYAVGFNNIDIVKAKELDIAVCNTRASSGDIVAEHAMALLYGLSSGIVWGDALVKKGKYNGFDPMLLRGDTLRGKTVGIVGVGDIGKHFARICKNGHGMQVLYFDIRRDFDFEKEVGAVFISSVDELLTLSDVVSLHVPLVKDTYHLIDKKRLSLMKKNAYLINTSRGPVIDEKALVDALEKEIIAGAGLDVFEFEPKLARGLSKQKNVILTPHIASATKENRELMSKIACQNIIDIFETGICQNRVN